LRLPFMAALLAVVLRVLIPAGFMISPSSAQAGLIQIELCSQNGTRTAWLAPDGSILDQSQAADHDGEPGTSTDHHDCAFATPAPTPPPPALTAAVVQVFVSVSQAPAIPVADLVPGRGLAAPPPPATAPPPLI
jgi:hypothetical protein